MDTENERLSRRMDRIEDVVSEALRIVNEKLDKLMEGQADFRATSAGLDRAHDEIGQLKARIEKLEKYSPFVEIVTNGLKGILTVIFRGSLVIGAAIVLAQAWPYFVKPPTVPVEIKTPK